MDKIVRFSSAVLRLMAKGGFALFDLLLTVIFVLTHPRELWRAICAQPWQVQAAIASIVSLVVYSSLHTLVA
ncbi:hypothetical protein [Cupriavidus sp. TMH.W2]|uniref:hypothetical protein n=1 Tax=Cupriavidus sp. TMH.W2 TaxID=3434465 RepID=UPI003D77E393